MKIAVLGGGRVGAAIARDLASTPGFEVTVADASAERVGKLAARGLAARQVDLAAAGALGALLAEHDLAVGAMPSHLGFRTLERVIEAGKPVVDISFFNEDPFALDALARERGVVAAVDCGVAPGLSNLVLGYWHSQLLAVERFVCYVGGLPVERRWPYEYKAPFAPADVLEEYVRPARQVVGGKVVVRPALSDPELIDFLGVGTLEAFSTDGLRTLLRLRDVPEMIEKTLRYPGHRDLMLALRESGFLGLEPVAAGEVAVVPRDLTARLLFPLWHLEEGEDELTVMRLEVEGRDDAGRRRIRYDLLDRLDRATGVTSMARTTGYTATAMVRLLAAGRYQEPGIAPPELIGRVPGCFSFLLADLAERGVVLRETVKELGDGG